MKRLLSLAFGLALLCAMNAGATLVFWDRNGTAPGAGGPSPTGTWSNDAYNWNTNGTGGGATGPDKWGDGDFAVFAAGNDATGAYTVTVSNAVTVADIHVDLGNVTFVPHPVAGGRLNMATWDGNSTNRLFSVGQKDPNTVATYNVMLTNAYGITRYKRGTMILGATNKITGPIVIEGGTLKLGVPYALPASCQLVLANNDTGRGDFNPDWQYTPAVFDTSGLSQKFDTLAMTGSDSTVLRLIDFGGGASALVFADSSALDWGPFVLAITNYTRNVDSLRFGTTASGLTAQQLSQISFVDYASVPGKISAQGFVTPDLPVILSINRAGTTVALVWTAVDGRAYRCQYKDALTDSDWIDLAPDVAGSGGQGSITDFDATSNHRYYRVIVLAP